MRGPTRHHHLFVHTRDAISFYCKRDFKQHKQVHTGKNKYPCPSRGCNKSYTTKGALKFHVHLHEELQFIGDICGKSFPQKAYLQQNMQGSHLGVEDKVQTGVYMAEKMHIHEDSCKACATLELKKKNKTF